MRWTTLAIGLGMGLGQPEGLRLALGWGLVLATYGAWRTFARRSVPSVLQASILDVGVAYVAVVGTGAWSSPFALCLLVGVAGAGFAGGVRPALGLAGGAAAAVSLSDVLAGWGTNGYSLHPAGQWAAELVLVAVLAGYGRRVFGEAELRHSAAMSRVSQLAQANSLLVSLHRVAQSLPASLNLEQVLASTVVRVRSVIASDVLAILIRDDASGTWAVLAGHGTKPGRSLTDGELPAPLAAATKSSVASLWMCLEPGERLGPDFLSHSGLYAPLRARDRLVGVIALEHHAPGFYGRRDLQVLDGLVESVALAVDNARWFSRLRAIGADQERGRIARDMHDRVGQSLAGVGFSLDRLHNQVGDEDLKAQVDQARSMVRSALGEVRDTLADLRTDVSDDRGVAGTLGAFLDRVSERSALTVTLQAHESRRLPLLQERELWRVAQEAVTNAERHAGARHLSVVWDCDGRQARLAIADDGQGFVPGQSGRPDSYGLTGMRERADGIGARLQIESTPGGGTMVRCSLGSPPVAA